MKCNVKDVFNTQQLLNKLIINSTFALGVLCSAQLFALPTMDKVVSGDANLTQSASAGVQTLQINQASDNAIINWKNFNISSNEAVHFQQPEYGVCLNRVDSANGMSQIHGNLSSTANIILINQAGILFGETAKVNIGGLIASTSDLADQIFSSEEKYVFDQSANLHGAIINKGEITLAGNGGLVALLGNSVSNEGVIHAKSANINLISGEKFTLDFYGNGVLQFAIDVPTTAPGLDEAGNPLAHGVEVSGEIFNDAGAVFITGKAAQGVFDNLINVSGEVHASSVTNRGGIIILRGESVGAVAITGELNVSASGVENKAGEVLVFGEEILVDDGAVVKADSDIVGGNIILGWPQGLTMDIGVPITASKTVYVGESAIISANAKIKGNGGRVAIWTADNTTFLGSASVKGGEVSGNGGLVFVYGSDTGSEQELANVDVSAANGKSGEAIFSSGADLINAFNQYLSIANAETGVEAN